MTTVIEATRDTLDELTSDGVALIDVWGPRCKPCLALAPHVERIATERPELTVVKIDGTQARRWCLNNQVMGLPTFLLRNGGAEVARLSSPSLGPDELEAWLDEHLQSLQGEEP